MSEETEIVTRLRELLRSQRFGVLCTCAPEGHPYGSLVAFAATESLESVVFATLRATRKFGNLSAEPRVSMLVDDRSNRDVDLRQAIAATILGRASEVVDAERESESALLVEKHPAMEPFVASPGCALLRIRVEAYYVVSRFQNVVEVHVGEGGARVVDPSSR